MKNQINYLCYLLCCAVGLSLLTSCGGQGEGTSKTGSSEKAQTHIPKENRILLFMDYSPNPEDATENRRLLRSKVSPLVEGICESEELRETPFVLKIFPVSSNTGNGEPVGEFRYSGEYINDDLFCQGLTAEFTNAIIKSFKKYNEKYQGQPSLVKIIDCLDVMKTEVGGMDPNSEELYVLLFSDLLERHSPADETLCQFNFLKEGRNEINEYSLTAAKTQLLEAETCIGKKTNRLKSVLSTKGDINNKVFVMPLYNSSVDISSGKANFNDIISFWQSFFAAAGMNYINLDKSLDGKGLVRKVFY